jgi:hypothetical protein
MKEAKIEIITLDPIMLGHCEHCEIFWRSFGYDHKKIQLQEYPIDILELSSKITQFINIITKEIYAKVYIIEAMTLRGLFKMLRYGSGKLPLIIVNGKKISQGKFEDPYELAEKALKIIKSSEIIETKA